MDKASFDKYCEERYEGQMKYYSGSASKNQRKYKLYQWILIILSALTPVIAALNGIKWQTENIIYTNSMNMLVVVISSVVAILTTGMKTFNYQELWITYRATYEKLKPEIYYYNFNIGEYGKPGIDKESMFVSRVEAILDTEHNQWPPAKKLTQNQNSSAENEPGQETPVTTTDTVSTDVASSDGMDTATLVTADKGSKEAL